MDPTLRRPKSKLGLRQPSAGPPPPCITRPEKVPQEVVKIHFDGLRRGPPGAAGATSWDTLVYLTTGGGGFRCHGALLSLWGVADCRRAGSRPYHFAERAAHSKGAGEVSVTHALPPPPRGVNHPREEQTRRRPERHQHSAGAGVLCWWVFPRITYCNVCVCCIIHGGGGLSDVAPSVRSLRTL